MTTLWKRKAAVVITRRATMATGTKIENLRVSFTGEKSPGDDANTLDLKIYNPAESTIAAALRKDGYLILEVGYGDEPMTRLFEGDIITAEIDRTPPETMLTIKIGDGHAAKSVKTSKAWNPGVNFSQIAKDLAADIKAATGLVVGEISSIFQSAEVKAKAQSVAENGYTVNGSTMKALKALANARGLDLSIQDNKLTVLLPDTPTVLAVVLTPESGLIGGIRRARDEKTGRDYYDFKALINPKIAPHSIARLNDGNIAAKVVIRSVKYEGDTHGQNWYATAQGVPI